jgi:hypothetical protein
MRRLSIVSAALVALLALGACGSSKGTSTPTTKAIKLSSRAWETAKPYPSTTARMICQTEARGEIAKGLGVTEKRVVATWTKKEHLYSCTYIYAQGRKIVLSVRELSNERQTTTYYDAIRKRYGTAQPLFGLGQGAAALKNGDIVVRKDYKVLLVDVKALPKGTGAFAPAQNRSNVANNIVAVIMACWPGA